MACRWPRNGHRPWTPEASSHPHRPPEKKRNKNNLTHALKEMVLLGLRKFEVSLGVVTIERNESMNKRLANREYIEEWR